MSAEGIVVPRSVSWGAVVAGAVVAAGISAVLLAFGSAIGLSVMSTAPTWRDSSALLWIISGLYLVFVALASFGFGGYVAGRMRAPMRPDVSVETEFRDGIHGIITWGLAVLIAAVLALGGAALTAPAVAPSGSQGPSASIAGENILASELDELFRTDRHLADNEIAYRRAEAGRILLKTSGHSGVPAGDRDYLIDTTAQMADLSDSEATARVDRVLGEAKQELRAARHAAILEAFMVAAALLLGAAVAWFAAAEGGRDREAGTAPVWSWSYRKTTVTL
jgi:hypothetical protein